MHCAEHHTEATGICPFCGRALCPDCALHWSGPRRACSPACRDGLKALDEAAVISTTKGKRTLKANVMFCIFLGSVFAAMGILLFVLSRAAWPPAAFLLVMGIALIIGGLIYARALREQVQAGAPPEAKPHSDHEEA